MIRERKWHERNLYLTGLYFHLCTYGEDIVKPLLWLVAIIFLGTLYWTIYYSQTPYYELNFLGDSSIHRALLTTNNEYWIIKAIERTLKNIVSYNDQALLGDTSIRIASAIVIGAIAICLRRKIERRFRD